MSDSPVSTHDPKEGGSDSQDSPTPQQQKQMESAYANMRRKMAMQEIGRKIKHKIMVLSGTVSYTHLTLPTMMSV